MVSCTSLHIYTASHSHHVCDGENDGLTVPPSNGLVYGLTNQQTD